MERVYTIPLRNVKNVKRTIRAPRAIREVKNFLTKHMKAEEVKIDESINHVIWARGLPGKDAPESSGILIAKTIIRLLERKEQP